MDPAQNSLPDPVGYLEDLIEMLRDGAKAPTGLHLDPEFCTGIADGLNDVRVGVGLLVLLAEQVRADHSPPPIPRRTRAESRILAIMATPLDDDGRVVAFPVWSGSCGHSPEDAA